MSEFNFGTPQFTDEDRTYHGSRFREVVDALVANPYQRVWGGPGEPPLPVYEVTFATVASHQFHQATERTVDSGADLRWGPDRKGSRRIVHPNGICLVGQWHTTATTEYPATSPTTAPHSSSRDTRRAAPKRVAATRDRSRWSENSFRRRIRTTPNRCERRTS